MGMSVHMSYQPERRKIFMLSLMLGKSHLLHGKKLSEFIINCEVLKGL